MTEAEKRVTRMKHSFQTEVERERQREPKILAMRRKQPEKRLTFYHIEEVKK